MIPDLDDLDPLAIEGMASAQAALRDLGQVWLSYDRPISGSAVFALAGALDAISADLDRLAVLARRAGLTVPDHH